jgi:hypothetical protein
MQTNSKSLGLMTGPASSFAIQLYEWAEASELAADYGHDKRKSEHACTNERFGLGISSRNQTRCAFGRTNPTGERAACGLGKMAGSLGILRTSETCDL